MGAFISRGLSNPLLIETNIGGKIKIMKITKKITLSLSHFLTAAAAIFMLALPAFAYEEDTHFQMTYVMCRSVGFTADEALIIASADQGMDDSPGVVAASDSRIPVPHSDAEWMWHALDKDGTMGPRGIIERKEILFEDALRELGFRNKLIRLGMFFHYQQDTWAHRNHYDTTATLVTARYENNHLSPNSYLTYKTPDGHIRHGHAPDRPPFDPAAALKSLEEGITYANRFLREALGRNPGSFLANYTPQDGRDDDGWTSPKKGQFFHQIEQSAPDPRSARSYLQNLIRTQIDAYTTSISPDLLFTGRFTPDLADLNITRVALEQICKDFESFRSTGGITNARITIPAKEQKPAEFSILTNEKILVPFPAKTSPAKQVTSAKHANGLLEVFYIGTDNKIYNNRQNSRSSTGWLTENAFGGSATQISAVANKDGRLEVFYIGLSGAVLHNFQRSPNFGPWSGEFEMGGAAKQLIADKNQDGRLEIFYIGTDDNIYHNWQGVPNGAWGGQSELGGKAKRITSIQNADGRLEIFYIGLDDRIYHNWQIRPNDAWKGEEVIGGSAKQIAVGRNPDGRLEIFYTGLDDSLFHNWQKTPGSNSWNGQAVLNGSAKQLSVATTIDSRLEIFYVNKDNKFSHNWQDTRNQQGAWVNESLLGGSAKQIFAISSANSRLVVFCVDSDNKAVFYKEGTNGNWFGPTPL